MTRTCGSWSAYCGGCRCEDCREAGRRYRESHRKQRSCLECGREWETGNAKAKFCSNACQAAHEHVGDRRPKYVKLSDADKRRRRAARKLARAMVGKSGSGTWTAGRCRRCGKSAVNEPWQQLGTIFYCSSKCRRAANAPCRGRGVNRQAIYARDGYRCYRCRRRVRIDKVMPHPLAPTLDHLVPVSEDPSRARDLANLRLACWDCNNKKSNQGGGEQLMLFG